MEGIICVCGKKVYFKQPIILDEVNPISRCMNCDNLFMPNYSHLNYPVILIQHKEKDSSWRKYEGESF